MLAARGHDVKAETNGQTALAFRALLLETALAGMIELPPEEQGGSDMRRAKPPSEDESFFSLPQARWVIGVLSMLIAVVGRESLLGLILRQTRNEIKSIVEDEEPGPTPASCYRNN